MKFRIDRRTFLERSGAAALVPLLGTERALGDEYLVKGLTGLARACDKPGWFQAHWGAAVLASYYLCRENDLDDRIKQAVKVQTDLLIQTYAPFFVPLEKEETDPALIDKAVRSLEQPIAGHRAHGHGPTLVTLGIRALKDKPEMASRRVVDGLCRIAQRIGSKPAAPDHDYNRKHPLGPYADESALVEATFDCILRYDGIQFADGGKKGAKRPNFTHRITFTDALVQLHRLGYGDLAARGHATHQIYVNTAPPAGAKKNPTPHPDARYDVVLSPGFWEDPKNARDWKNGFHVAKNRMGHWIVGHLFKVLYSYVKLRKLVKDPGKVERVDRIILERYVNRAASGG